MRFCHARTGGLVAVLGAVAFLVGCQQETPPDPDTTTAAVEEAVNSRQRELALAAQKELFERLSGRLMEVMSQDGPVAAIDVCSQEALQITKQVGETHKVTIGRTSFRLRNDKNAPPTWAAELVEQRVAEPQFVDLQNDHLGALLPIHLKPQCLLCHGPKDDIADDVKQALATAYPNDQATGFAADELRGWFWVEVPAPE